MKSLHILLEKDLCESLERKKCVRKLKWNPTVRLSFAEMMFLSLNSFCRTCEAFLLFGRITREIFSPRGAFVFIKLSLFYDTRVLYIQSIRKTYEKSNLHE